MLSLAGSGGDQTRINWLKKTLRVLPDNSSILDAGAGELRLKPYCSHLRYVSQDFCQYKGVGDGNALQTGIWDTSQIDIISNICSMPVADSSFDAVLCSEVLEHIPDPVQALMEFKRVLKPHGILILTAPFSSLTHFAPYHFASGFNRYWYEEHLVRMGFKIDEITPNGNWFEFMGQELSRARFVSRTYSSSVLSWFMFGISIPLRIVLGMLSKLDRGSDELLCYGFMVKAHKVDNQT